MAKKRITITVTNQKGGVGKTTSVVNIAHGLALLGKRVLIIDFDPQANASEFLGLQPINNIRTLLEEDKVARERDLATMILPTGRENLDIIASNDYSADLQLTTAKYNATMVRTIIDNTPELEEYDFIIFDTSPSVGGLQEKAIFAADQIIAPTLMTRASLGRLTKLFDDFNTMQNFFSWPGKLYGILPCRFERVTNESLDAYEALQNTFPKDAILDPISKSVRFDEAHRLGQTIHEYAPNSTGAKEYFSLAKKIIRFT